MAFFKRCVPWILILVLSISLLPVTNAAAASASVSGEWKFTGKIYWDYDLDVDISFGSAESVYSSISWDAEREQFWYNTSVDDLCVYDGLNGGWIHTDFMTILVDGEFQLDEDAYAFFTANAAPLLPLYANTIYIGDSSFVFVARGASPTVNIEVTSTGCTLSSDDDTQYWIYQGDGEFLGFAINDDGVLTIPVGLTTTCRGLSGDHNSYRLYPCVDDGSSGGGSSPEDFYHFSGEWKFTGKIYWDEDLSVDIPFGSAEYECSSILWDAEREQLWYVTSDNDLCVYDGSSGWTHADFMTILVDGDIQLAEAAYEFFSSNAVQISTGGDSGSTPSDIMSASFLVGGKTYVFYGDETTLPEVVVTVSAGGVTLSSGSSSYFHEHGSDVLGYKLTPNADDYIGIGEVFVFSSDFAFSSYGAVLYPFYNSDALYVTTVNIYDSSGTKLLGSYQAHNVGASPVFNLTVLSDGCLLVAGDYSFRWKLDEGSFYGLSPAMYTASPYYVPGSTYTLPGGDISDLTISLFVHDKEYNSLPGISLVDWLKTAVGGFLSFELWPGLSLDEVLYFILVIKLLFWFLKVIN